jgi:hypothetical protein
MGFRVVFGLSYLVLGLILLFSAYPEMYRKLDQTVTTSRNNMIQVQAESVSVIKGEIEGNRLLGEKELVQAVLEAAGLQKWKTFAELHHKIVAADFYFTEGEELLVAVSMPPDQGVIGVVGETLRGYVVVATIKDLVPVTTIGIIDLPGLNHSALVVEEYLNEMAGAFFEMARLTIYGVVKGQIKQLWQREKYVKAYWNEAWDNGASRWLQHFEHIKISFFRDGRIEGQGEKQSLVAEANNGFSLPVPEEFKLVNTDPVRFVYSWDPNSFSFKAVLGQ